MTAAATLGAAAKAAIDQATSGLPPTSTKAFGPPAPSLSPEPAAAINAVAGVPSGRGLGAEALLEEFVDVLLGALFVLIEGVHEL